MQFLIASFTLKAQALNWRKLMKFLSGLCTVFVLAVLASVSLAQKRFEQPVVKVSDPHAYTFVRNDEVEYPSLAKDGLSVSSLVFRGQTYYYVEVVIKNDTSEDVAVPAGAITFDKTGYTVVRVDPQQAIAQLSQEAGIAFVPTPPPVISPGQTTTTYSGTASTYGNQTYINGSATTRTDNSGQAGANFGNAIGNAIAAHQFYKAQHAAVQLAGFLRTFGQTAQGIVVKPGETRTVVCTFAQFKQKKAPFSVDIRLGTSLFEFKYKE
jgi:hypothetical protein